MAKKEEDDQAEEQRIDRDVEEANSSRNKLERQVKDKSMELKEYLNDLPELERDIVYYRSSRTLNYNDLEIGYMHNWSWPRLQMVKAAAMEADGVDLAQTTNESQYGRWLDEVQLLQRDMLEHEKILKKLGRDRDLLTLHDRRRAILDMKIQRAIDCGIIKKQTDKVEFSGSIGFDVRNMSDEQVEAETIKMMQKLSNLMHSEPPELPANLKALKQRDAEANGVLDAEFESTPGEPAIDDEDEIAPF